MLAEQICINLTMNENQSAKNKKTQQQQHIQNTLHLLRLLKANISIVADTEKITISEIQKMQILANNQHIDKILAIFRSLKQKTRYNTGTKDKKTKLKTRD